VSGYHNYLEYKGDLALLEDVLLRHYGYDLDDQRLTRKLDRTEEIILRELKKGPGDFRGYFYLAHIAACRKNPEAALKHGETYVQNAAREPGFNASIYHIMIRCALSLGEPDLTEKWMRRGLEALPSDLDIAFDQVLYGEWRQRPDLVMDGARRYWALYDEMESGIKRLGNRWIYTYTAREHAWVCRRAAKAFGDHLSVALERHKAAAGAMQDKEAEEERSAIADELQGIGVKWTNQEEG